MASTTTFEDSDSDGSAIDPESDDESLIDVDGPVDGYFSQRDVPRQTYTENPALASEEKEREAAEERQRQTSQAQSATARTQPTGFEESAPLLDAGPAPPDYYEATAGRREPPRSYREEHGRQTSYGSILLPSPSQGNGRSGQSFGNDPRGPSSAPFRSDHPLVRNGLFGDQGVLNGEGRPPQIMEDSTQPTHPPRPQSYQAPDHDPIHNELGYYHFRKRPNRWHKLRSCCRMSCLNMLLVLALIVAVIFLTAAPHEDDVRSNPHQNLPVDRPPESGLPIPSHPNIRQCSFVSTSMYEAFDFYDPGNFSFLEMIDESAYTHFAPSGARLSGIVRVAPFQENESAVGDDVSIRVWVHAATTNPWILDSLNVVRDEDGFQLRFPDIHVQENGEIWDEYEAESSVQPCLDFAVLIQVKKDVELRNWDLATANLDIQVQDGISAGNSVWPQEAAAHGDEFQTAMDKRSYGLLISNATSMYAIGGSIDVTYWSSRRTRISTHSGSISGTFDLRDSLEIESHSGSVKVGVDPKKAASEDPDDAPADFSVKTHSGEVNVDFPSRHDDDQSAIPVRQYRSHIETSSAEISGRYILGTLATFTSHSGDIDVFVLPYSADEWNSTLHTTTFSAQTNLNLLGSLKAIPFSTGGRTIDPGSPHLRQWDIGSIYSVHKSHSGQLVLRYPDRWAGVIDGKSQSGDLKVRGKDVKIVTDVNGPGFRRVVARKGIGASVMRFKTDSGEADILVGEESDDDL